MDTMTASLSPPSGSGRTLFILSGPSGVGKATILKRARQKCPEIRISVSCTTRAPRPGEVDGVDYHFISREEFMRMASAGEFLEWAEYAGNLYGTPRSEIVEGTVTVLEIEIEGARKVKQARPETPMIFVLPPSRETLNTRILKRGAMTTDELGKRLRRATEELVEGPAIADYFLVNHDGDEALDEAVDHLLTVLRAA